MVDRTEAMGRPLPPAATPAPAGRGLASRATAALLWLGAIVAVVRYDQVLGALWRHVGEGVPSLWSISMVLTGLLNPFVLTLGVLLVSMLDRRVRWRLLRDAAAVMVSQTVACDLLKRLFGRLRPDVSAGATLFLGPSLSGDSFSFPSGHAMAAFALAATLTAFYPRWRWLFVAAALAVCLARVQLNRHFFGDTVAAGVVGWYLASALLAWLGRAGNARRTPPTPAW